MRLPSKNRRNEGKVIVVRNGQVVFRRSQEIANLLKVSPKSANNKYPLWSGVAYGLVNRTDSDAYEVAETGRKIVAPEYPGEDTEGKIKALLTPRILSKFFTDFNGHPLPELAHFPNVLENRYHVPRERTGEAISLIKANGLFAGVLQKQPDDSFIVRVDKAAPTGAVQAAVNGEVEAPRTEEEADGENPQYDWKKTCFVITPLGEEGMEQRRHADMLFKHVLEPVAKEFDLTLVRADKIERSGLITQQIFEQLVKARLCVADLSFTNANVFYELGVRHTCKLPSIQLIRKGDKIPFDVAQGRTIIIDTTDIYSIVDRLTSAQRELSQHVKHILASESNEPGDDNPVHLYLPKVRMVMS